MAKRKLFTTEGLSNLNRVVVKEGVGATRGDGLKINFLITWNIDPGVSDGSALSFLSREYWATSIPKFCEKMDMRPGQALFRTNYSGDHQFF